MFAHMIVSGLPYLWSIFPPAVPGTKSSMIASSPLILVVSCNLRKSWIVSLLLVVFIHANTFNKVRIAVPASTPSSDVNFIDTLEAKVWAKTLIRKKSTIMLSATTEQAWPRSKRRAVILRAKTRHRKLRAKTEQQIARSKNGTSRSCSQHFVVVFALNFLCVVFLCI